MVNSCYCSNSTTSHKHNVTMAVLWSFEEVGRLLGCVDHCVANSLDFAAAIPGLMRSKGYDRTWAAISSRLSKLSADYRNINDGSGIEVLRQHGSRGLDLPNAHAAALDACRTELEQGLSTPVAPVQSAEPDNSADQNMQPGLPTAITVSIFGLCYEQRTRIEC